MTDSMIQRSLQHIADCVDAKQLRRIAINAQAVGNDEVRRAAQLRLYSILPSEKPGTLEYDVWQSIHALEGTLSDERGKTTRLSRTRQKITRDGEHKTVSDLILGSQSEGFNMLMARNMGGLTFEAVALKHRSSFSEDVLEAATSRLGSAGFETNTS